MNSVYSLAVSFPFLSFNLVHVVSFFIASFTDTSLLTDIVYFAPNNKQQSELGEIVYNIVAGNKNKTDYNKLVQTINDYEYKNVDCVVLACTDLQLLKPVHPKLKIFDTMKIFADATVENMLR